MDADVPTRRYPARALTGIVAVLALTGCVSPEGEAPVEVRLTAETDSTVKLTWVMPTGKAASQYEVFFRAVDEPDYALVVTAWSTEATHDPEGRTGDYRLAAVFGRNRYEAVETLTTVPVATAPTTLFDLGTSGLSGYGWNREAGGGAAYPMDLVSSIDSVDFYFSDWDGVGGDTCFIVSPEHAPLDPGGSLVPAGSWRRNDFAPVISEHDPLPVYEPGVYATSQPILADTSLFAVRTTDTCFGLVRMTNLNRGAGTVTVETWFQPVKGLRLAQH